MSSINTFKDHFKENQLFLNRTVVTVSIVIIMLSILIARLIYLQVYQHDLYATLSQNNQIRIVPIQPTRGLIYDRNNVLLAENIPVFSLDIIPKKVADLTATITNIRKIIPISDAELATFNKRRRYRPPHESTTLKFKLTQLQVAKFSVDKYLYPGIEVVARLTRNYPYKDLLAHVLGYVGLINERHAKHLDKTKYRGTYYVGKTGIEKYYEAILHGAIGYNKVETNSRGMPIRILSSTLPSPGQDLQLTLDIKLQQAATKALGKNNGAVIAIDPASGDILALVSKPSFDPNLFVQGIDAKQFSKLQTSQENPLFNRAISGQYPPGSVIKPLIALLGIEEGAINKRTQIYDPGWYKLNNDSRLFRDMKRSGHGWTNIDKALYESCDTFFYSLSHKLGIDKIQLFLRKFGLGSVTGVDLIGESAGLIPSRHWKRRVKQQPWYPGETLNIGIGQGFMLTTPIQMAYVTATIANRGKRFTPKLLTGAAKPLPSVTINQQQNWNTVIKAMHKVIVHSRGTAHRELYKMPFSIAGKTGTAQVFGLKQDKKQEALQKKLQKSTLKLKDHSWFIAFAPVDNPQIALVVLIEHGHSSVKVARKVLSAYFKGKKG